MQAVCSMYTLFTVCANAHMGLVLDIENTGVTESVQIQMQRVPYMLFLSLPIQSEGV